MLMPARERAKSTTRHRPNRDDSPTIRRTSRIPERSRESRRRDFPGRGILSISPNFTESREWHCAPARKYGRRLLVLASSLLAGHGNKVHKAQEWVPQEPAAAAGAAAAVVLCRHVSNAETSGPKRQAATLSTHHSSCIPTEVRRLLGRRS